MFRFVRQKTGTPELLGMPAALSRGASPRGNRESRSRTPEGLLVSRRDVSGVPAPTNGNTNARQGGSTVPDDEKTEFSCRDVRGHGAGAVVVAAIANNVAGIVGGTDLVGPLSNHQPGSVIILRRSIEVTPRPYTGGPWHP